MHWRCRNPRGSKTPTVLLLMVLFLASCRQAQGMDARLSAIVKPYRFNVMHWELSELLRRPAGSRGDATSQSASRGAVSVVDEYMTLLTDVRQVEAESGRQPRGEGGVEIPGQLQTLQERKRVLASEVERILGTQIRQVLQNEGIYNPADRLVRLGVAFPPLYFRLQKPPHTLIVSPRERIESMREEMLLQELSPEAVDEIETKVDALGVSALVEEIGGFGATFPTFVSDDASLYWIVKAATEEWLHQYLAFTPLGFAYVLDLTGVARNYDIATMNETVAGMVSAEIATRVMQTYYPDYLQPRTTESRVEPEIDFNSTMREIRLKVDDMLAKGQVDQAEEFMQERRQYLQEHGYYIRRLNQAYFAFYGTYADMPSSVSPIGEDLRELQRRSSSLRDFLNAAAGMHRLSDLQELLQGVVISKARADVPATWLPSAETQP